MSKNSINYFEKNIANIILSNINKQNKLPQMFYRVKDHEKA